MERKTKNCHSKCPICGGTGLITRKVNGIEFGKNCECINRAIFENKLKFANIPEDYRNIKVSDFKTTIYQKEESRKLAKDAREIVKNYILNFDKMDRLGKGLYFYSDKKGSGKTMLALALANALMSRNGIVAKYATVSDILKEIKNTYDKDGNRYRDKFEPSKPKESELIDDLRKVKVLILDDIGVEKLTGWSNEIIYQIINERLINKLVTIFTSNTHISQLKHDERIISRIKKMSIPIQMPEESIRDQLGEKENMELVKELLGV